ncbi:hypothetical protein FA95DRAFT_1483827 [Auriscalpium vulgare]|uniref:Uncharacterized protein n=1 Tax=Auriscalpium vulgare TaxID=40419 RepID=A0ACB8S6X4_9AGAM|nr:hypothetical protein FA95DRAFT_1483827 [Auriscalpium vulgare]
MPIPDDPPAPYEAHAPEALPEYALTSPTSSPTIQHAGVSISREHTFSLKNKNARDWITLVVRNRAQNEKHLPLFFDRDVIAGEIHMDLDKAETLKGVTIGVQSYVLRSVRLTVRLLQITAATTAVGQEDEPFLDLVEPVWTPEGGSGKLKGKYTWPFSITLPPDTSVALTPKSTPQRYALPPTFSERASPAYIDYKLSVTVRRGGLRVNNKLSTSFVYLPRSVAEPPSLMRTIAYQEMTPLLGPEEDPPGWKVFPPLTVEGTLFNTRSVSVQCTFAVALPLSCASNSPLPLLMTLRGTDAQALDLLAAAPHVQLQRVVAIGSDATDESVARRSNNTFIAVLAKAAFWPDEAMAEANKKNGSGASGIKVMQGELYLPKGIKPTFSFPRLSVRYNLVVLPPQVSGFVPSVPVAEPLLSERITVALANARGVVPRSHVPPGYAVEIEGNYNVATGFLENGNQRFLGHHH